MAVNYANIYAQIDVTTKMCIGLRTSDADLSSETLIPIPVYDTNYVFKYYIDGSWYEDAAGTIPW